MNMRIPELPNLPGHERDAILRICVGRALRPRHYLAGGLLALVGGVVGAFLCLRIAGRFTTERSFLLAADGLGTAVGLGAVVLALGAISVRRLRRRFLAELVRHARCTSCGYDLRATPAGGCCPECGATPEKPAAQSGTVPPR